MNDDPVIAVFKLGEKDKMTELLHEGHVFMNSLSYFAKLENDSPRSDPDEGVGYYHQADGATFQMQNDERWTTIGAVCGGIRFRNNGLTPLNIYCLHSKKQSQYGNPFKLDQLSLGDSYVLFLDVDEFIRRLRMAITKAGHELRYGLVNYVDRQVYSGPMSTFTKFSEHADQNEFRIAATPGTNSPISIRIGDLSDIAIMGSTSERLLLDPKQPPHAMMEPVSP